MEKELNLEGELLVGIQSNFMGYTVNNQSKDQKAIYVTVSNWGSGSSAEYKIEHNKAESWSRTWTAGDVMFIRHEGNSYGHAYYVIPTSTITYYDENNVKIVKK